MWSSDAPRLAALAALGVLALMAGGCAGPSSESSASSRASEAGAGCPAREAPLRVVEVFDGKPEELALLVPDDAGERAGSWKLGYIYDAGRTVTLRCKYGDGHQSVVHLARRVERCQYRVPAPSVLALTCR